MKQPPMTITAFYSDDAYEVTWDGENATIILFRACADGRGEVVDFNDLQSQVQMKIMETVREAIRHQRRQEQQEQEGREE
jgi:hypothetical protein